jgi:hypothetical protein
MAPCFLLGHEGVGAGKTAVRQGPDCEMQTQRINGQACGHRMTLWELRFTLTMSALAVDPCKCLIQNQLR